MVQESHDLDSTGHREFGPRQREVNQGESGSRREGTSSFLSLSPRV